VRVADRRPERLSRLCELLPAHRLDALLVSSLPNIRYLTGFSGTSALLVVGVRETLLVTDFRYATQVREEVGELARVQVEGQSLWTGLWRTLPEIANVEVIGFESGQLLHRDFARLLEAGARWQWRPTLDVVEGLRETKDAGEIEAIAQAVGVAEAALDRAMGQVQAGATEMQVAGWLEAALRAEGSEGFPFPTIVASGPRAALPHARTSARCLEAGEVLLIDFGAVVSGYCADVTRTFAISRADEHMREIHGIVYEANARASAGVRAGMTGQDADALARRYIEDCGYGEQFGHSLGHGLGLEVHEAPRLARMATGVVPAGAVVTIEPGIYEPGWGGVRIEDDVVLEDGGPRVLTSFSRELRVLG
jgi:Xaa-Pro aminopeptidase